MLKKLDLRKIMEGDIISHNGSLEIVIESDIQNIRGTVQHTLITIEYPCNHGFNNINYNQTKKVTLIEHSNFYDMYIDFYKGMEKKGTYKRKMNLIRKELYRSATDKNLPELLL